MKFRLTRIEYAFKLYKSDHVLTVYYSILGLKRWIQRQLSNNFKLNIKRRHKSQHDNVVRMVLGKINYFGINLLQHTLSIRHTIEQKHIRVVFFTCPYILEHSNERNVRHFNRGYSLVYCIYFLQAFIGEFMRSLISLRYVNCKLTYLCSPS